jgi:hypothetical protein
MGTRSRLALLFGLLVLAGCGASPYFRPHAFVPPLRHYRVRYLDAATQHVLAPEWQILNFDRGRIPETRTWMTRRVIDEGGGPRRVNLPVFDLLAEHERDGASLFLMTVPLESTMGRRELSIVAHDFVDELLGSALSVVRRTRGDTTEEHLVASRVLEDQAAEVGGAEAHLMTVERAQVGAASGSNQLFTFVLVRPPRRWRSSGVADASHGAPMLILAGLESRADRYDSHRPDFDQLLDRLDVRPE